MNGPLLSQLLDPVEDVYFPVSQAVHEDALVCASLALYVPSEHLVQAELDVLPVAVLYVPAGQALHEACPV